MTLVRFFVLALALLAAAGCGAKKKPEITSLQRKEAANIYSEAQFALTIRDYPRAEGLLAKATELCPDTGPYWTTLGTTRMKLKQRDAARKAYQQALEVYGEAAAEAKTDPQPRLEQVTILLLLGRADDAKALLDKLPKEFPDNRQVRAYIDGKMLERMLADPKFKEVAL